VTNHQELRDRKQKEAEEKARARAKAQPQRSVIASAKEIRLRHATLRRKKTDAEAKAVTAAFKQRLSMTRHDIEREAEIAKRIADFEEGERQQAEIDPHAPLALADMPTAQAPLPSPGLDRDAHAARQRDERLREAPDTTAVADWVPAGVRRTYAALIRNSDPWKKSFVTPQPTGWRRVSVSELTPYDILEGLVRPEPPWPAGWTTQNPAPQLPLEDVVRASQKLAADLEILRNIGLYREVAGPAWAEISLDGLL
jgi:hypothetical protein